MRRILPVALFVGAFSWSAHSQFTFDHVGGGATGSIVTNVQNGSYTFEGGGDDIWSASDSFDYAHFDAVGDFDLRVRVESLEFTATWTKAGLMARETLAANSRMAFNRVTPQAGANDTRYAFRTGVTLPAQGENEIGTGNPGYPNAWLRLQRVGSVFEAFRSTDGTTWTSQGAQDTTTWEGGALPATVLLGLAVSRHSGADPLATAQFRDFGSPSNAIQVGQQPVPTAAAAGTTANFSITVPGGYDFVTIQWNSNGVPIVGAPNSPNYTTPVLTVSADGALYSATVSNNINGTTATSAGAALDVFDFPVLVSVSSLGDPNGVYVTYSRQMDGTTVLNPMNYTLQSVGNANLLAPGNPILSVGAMPGDAASSISTVGTTAGANNYPANESPDRAIDGSTGSKYLNFAEVNVGLIVTRPGGAAPVQGVRFASANDAPERDPLLVSIEGTMAADPTTAAGGAVWTPIYAGTTGLDVDPGRSTQGPLVTFANAAAFNTFRILVTGLRDAGTANSVQFSEVQLVSTGGVAVAVSGVTPFGTGGSQVRLAVSALEFGRMYELSVANVQDAAANTISPNPSIGNFTHMGGVSATPIGLSMRRFDGSGDFGTILGRINSCAAPARNDVNIATMEYGTNPQYNSTDGNTENYGAWLHGLFVPPVTGNYVFGISSDDRSELYISTDASPANKIMVAQQITWNAGRNFVDGFGPTGLPIADQPFIGRITTPIRMIAGRSYYMETVVAEGGGGDHVTIAVQKPGDPQIGTAGNVLGIPRSLFSTNYEVGCPPTAFFRTPGPVAVVGASGDQAVGEGQLVDFVVTADGTAPYSYQWYSNGVAIAGATQASLSFRPLRGANGAQFNAVVSNPFSSATSTVATLTVNNDVTAPLALRAYGSGVFTNITIEFNEPVDIGTATEVSNYTITNSAGTILNVHAASIRDGTNVVLRTEAQTSGQRYWVVVNNVGDAAGVPNPIAANTVVSFTAWIFSPGFALNELFRTPLHLGNNIDVLKTNSNYPYYADRRDYITSADSRVIFSNDAHEHYGGKISGLFIPDVSQNYTFRLSNDDDGQVNGSLNENPADAQTIINAVCCNGAFGNASPAIPLVAGSRYYYEMLWKEGTGGDYGRLSIDGTAPIPSSFLGVYANPDSVSLTITQQPPRKVRAANQIAGLSVGTMLTIFDGASRPLLYQWYSNGVAVAGATARTYVTAPLSLANDGDIYSVQVRTPGALLVSSNAVVNVIVDVTGPVLLSAATTPSFKEIVLTWNEPVAEGPAIEPGNYIIKDAGNNEIPVDTVVWNGSNVVVKTLSALQQSSVYSMEIDFQTDQVGNPTDPVGMPTIDVEHGIVTNFTTFVVSCGFARFEAYLGLSVPNNNNLSPLTNAINAGVSPSFFFYSNVVNWPQSSPDINNYGMRWTFWFIAPTTGNYKFEPSHDDGADIYVALDGNPANKVGPVYHQDCCSGFGSGEGGYSVDLTAGQTIYLELLVIEAGGGDYAGLAVVLPGGTYQAPINSSFIAQIVDPSVGASSGVGIAQQPQNQAIFENGTATFTVAVTNAGPWGANYQWQVDTGSGFTDIVGARSASYTTPIQTLANDGDVYRVNVYVIGKTVASDPATLTVAQDVVAPTVVAARTVRKHDAIIVNFSELIDAASATTLANYSLVDSNNAPVALPGPVTVLPDGKSVRIASAVLDTSSFYTVHVENVMDLVNLTMQPTNVTFQTWIWSRGVVNFEAFLGLSVPDYQNPQPVIDAINSGVAPSFEFQTNVANWPQSAPDLNNYGMHLFGVFRAPITGAYKFEPAHDDSGNLLFSPDTNPANAVLAMDFDCCSGFGSGEAGHNVNLVAGQGYFFDLRVVEAGGGDYAGLSVTLPGGQYIAPIPGQFLETFADPVGASVTITQQPQDRFFFGGSGVPILAENFNTGDGGFTVTTPQAYDGPWTYNAGAGSWRQTGQNAENGHPNTSYLDSPPLAITASGQVILSFSHRYSFEGGGWDGGQVRVSVNGGAFTAVPGGSFTANGYNGSVVAGSSSLLAGQAAFVETSPGFTLITSTATLGSFNPGDSIVVRFMAGNDSNTQGENQPNWEIDSVQVNQGAEQTVTFTVGASAMNAASGSNPPRVYQWSRNDGTGWVEILGANGPSYTFAPTIADTETQYRVAIYIPGASAVSSAATLIVGGPKLRIVRSGGQTTISWNGNYCLEETHNLNGTPVWTPSAVQNGVPFTPSLIQNTFYRLKTCP